MYSLGKFPPSYFDTVALPLNVFKFVGFDFFDDPKNYVRNRCKFVLYLIGFLTFVSSQILFMVMVDETGATFIDMANAIPCLFMVFMGGIKLIILVRKKHLIRNIVLDIAALWPSDSQDERKEKSKNARLRDLKTFAIIIFKCTGVGLLVYIWLPMFICLINSLRDDDTPYKFPFQLYYHFKIDSLWKYLLVYLVQSVLASIIHMCVFHASDLLMYTLTLDVCVIFRMLEYDLVNLKVEREGSGAEQSLTSLKRIVNTHQKLIRLTDDLNDMFGIILLTELVFSSVVLCFFGFLAIVAKEKYQIFISVSTAAQGLFQVFFVTVPGEVLTNTSCGFADAAYESLWYEGDSRFRSIICIIIARSQKPCTLRAMGYTDMNFATYSKICSSAWSYLSLINQMYQNVEFEF